MRRGTKRCKIVGCNNIVNNYTRKKYKLCKNCKRAREFGYRAGLANGKEKGRKKNKNEIKRLYSKIAKLNEQRLELISLMTNKEKQYLKKEN